MPPETPAANQNLKQQRDMLASYGRAIKAQLKADHSSARAAFTASTGRMMRDASARARAEVMARYGHLMAMLMAEKGTPDFAARFDALLLEQGAAMDARVGELTALVRDERNAARGLMRDKHVQERKGLAVNLKRAAAILAPSNPHHSFGSRRQQQRQRQRMGFAMASRLTTNRRMASYVRPQSLNKNQL